MIIVCGGPEKVENVGIFVVMIVSILAIYYITKKKK